MKREWQKSNHFLCYCPFPITVLSLCLKVVRMTLAFHVQRIDKIFLVYIARAQLCVRFHGHGLLVYTVRSMLNSCRL